jgi:hypothetical protein
MFFSWQRGDVLNSLTCSRYFVDYRLGCNTDRRYDTGQHLHRHGRQWRLARYQGVQDVNAGDGRFESRIITEESPMKIAMFALLPCPVESQRHAPGSPRAPHDANGLNPTDASQRWRQPATRCALRSALQQLGAVSAESRIEAVSIM